MKTTQASIHISSWLQDKFRKCTMCSKSIMYFNFLKQVAHTGEISMSCYLLKVKMQTQWLRNQEFCLFFKCFDYVICYPQTCSNEIFLFKTIQHYSMISHAHVWKLHKYFHNVGIVLILLCLINKRIRMIIGFLY